jgi:hypothetical protein
MLLETRHVVLGLIAFEAHERCVEQGFGRVERLGRGSALQDVMSAWYGVAYSLIYRKRERMRSPRCAAVWTDRRRLRSSAERQ